MKHDRTLRILRPSLALLALAAALVLLGLAIAGPARAAASTPSPAATPAGAVVVQRDDVVRFGEDVLVPKGTQVPTAAAFGGDIRVEGTVTDAVIAFGGDVIVNGTVGGATVAFGGDVTVGPTAVVGRDLSPTEASLILFGGKLTRSPSATVTGEVQTFNAVDWDKALGWAARSIFVNPLWGLSFWGWVVQTAFFLVLALVAAALMPRQLRGVHRHLGAKPWASLGWGALLFFIVGPAILVVLVISVIGLLLVVPYGLFVLLAYFFVTTGVASFLAQKVLTGFGGKENLMLAVTIGVLMTTVVSRIPVAGPLLVAGMMIFGAGAAALGVAEWRRTRREQAAIAAASAAAAGAAPGAYPYPGTATATAPAVIMPMVETSPALPAGDAAGEAGTAVTQAPVPPPAPQAPVPPADPEVPAAASVADEAEQHDEVPGPGSGEAGPAPA